MTTEQSKTYVRENERIIVQLIHWGIVLSVAIMVLVLALRHDIDHASVTALYGGILGHAGTSASHKLQDRIRED